MLVHSSVSEKIVVVCDYYCIFRDLIAQCLLTGMTSSVASRIQCFHSASMVPKTPLAVEFSFLEYGHPTATPGLLEDFILTTFLKEEVI